jgi:hypothetical protein
MLKVASISAAILLSCGLAHAQGTSGATTPPSPTNSGMAQPADIQNKPKLYQPVNPAPDTRSAPTSSSTGLGADNGGRPEEQPKK